MACNFNFKLDNFSKFITFYVQDDQNMEELDTEEYIKRIRALNKIKDSYEFSTSSQARIHPNLLLWNFLRDEERDGNGIYVTALYL